MPAQLPPWAQPEPEPKPYPARRKVPDWAQQSINRPMPPTAVDAVSRTTTRSEVGQVNLPVQPTPMPMRGKNPNPEVPPMDWVKALLLRDIPDAQFAKLLSVPANVAELRRTMRERYQWQD